MIVYLLSGYAAAIGIMVFSLGREGIFHRGLGTTDRLDNPVNILMNAALPSGSAGQRPAIVSNGAAT